MTFIVFEKFRGEFCTSKGIYFVGKAKAGKVVRGLGRRDTVNEKTEVPP